MHPARWRWVCMVSIGTLILTGWGVSAQERPPIDHMVDLSPGQRPVHEGDPDELAPVHPQGDEQYAWNLTTEAERLIIEIRIASGTFAVDRSAQIVPTLTEPDAAFPYFDEWPDPRVWQAEEGSRVYNRSLEDDEILLRLRIPGPTTGRLALSTDTTPPTILLGEVTDINATGFTYRVRTDEPTRLDIALRTGPDWNRTNASDLNADHIVRFDRLRPQTVYAVHIIARDWAGNLDQHNDHVTTRANTSRLALEPIRPMDTVAPDAEVVIEVRVRNLTVPLAETRATLDGDPLPAPQEMGDRLLFLPVERPGPGPHLVHVEVTDDDGKSADVSWTFSIPHTNATGRPLAIPPAPMATGVLLLIGVVILVRRHQAP